MTIEKITVLVWPHPQTGTITNGVSQSNECEKSTTLVERRSRVDALMVVHVEDAHPYDMHNEVSFCECAKDTPF